MAKSKYEKMEIMLEDIMRESDIDTKIEEMKNEIEEEPKGKGNSKEEYRKSIQEDKKRKEELSKKLKFYEAFKNNKGEILNIREYQLSLQKKLDKLEKEKAIAESLDDYNESLGNESEKIDKELEEIMQKREDIAEKLKNKDLSTEERKELLDKDKKLIGEIDNNSRKFQVIQKYKKIETKGRDIEEISKDILSTQIKISKCNMIWSSLLKGKDWDQIGVILNTGDFTAKKGTIDKIRQLKDASQIKTKNKVNTKNTTLKVDGINEINGVQTNLPKVVKPPFKERHPRLAKIPFLAKIVDKFNNKTDNSKHDDKPNSMVNSTPKSIGNIEDEKALNYIEKRMEKDEVAMFKSIAKNGFKESMKIDLEQRRAEAKKAAIEREADKFGGRYKKDDAR